jgi:ligand-binding sensor domain-containing protein/two-component sensor histidine kinase
MKIDFNRILKTTLIFLGLSFRIIYPAEPEYIFTNIGVEHGLSQSTIFSIVQDQKGFLWFATNNGLNRYDGYSFKVYSFSPFDSSSISDNGITTLFKDRDGDIWIGTKEGVLNKYDYQTDSFQHFFFNSDMIKNKLDEKLYSESLIAFSRNNSNTISTIDEDSKGNLWIGTWGEGIIKFDKSDGSWQRVYASNTQKNELSSNRITKILIDSEEVIWVGTFGKGINRVSRKIRNSSSGESLSDPDAVEISYFTFDKRNIHSLSSNNVLSIFEDSFGNIWVGTFGYGLNKLAANERTKSSDKVKFEKYFFTRGNSLSSNTVMAITEDKQKQLWFATFGGGLDKFDTNTQKFMNFKHDPLDNNSIIDDDLLSLYFDKSGILWIGTHLGAGLSILKAHNRKFNLIDSEMGNDKSLSDAVVWAIHQDSQEILWVGTYRGGLNRIDRKQDEYKVFKRDPLDLKTISDNHIRSITEDKYGYLWIGTFNGGLNRFDKNTGKVTRYQHNPQDKFSIASNQVQSIYIDKNSTVWIAAYGGGLCSFKLPGSENENITFTRYQHDAADNNSIGDNRAYHIIESSKGEIWITTHGGVSIFDKSKKTFKNYAHDPLDNSTIAANKNMSVIEDPYGNIWVGSYGGGLNKFDRATETFIRYSEMGKFPSDAIYGILEDDSKNLWISSDDGLFKYSIDNEYTVHYKISDGLQSREFSGGAYLKTNTGEMFFGGIKGLNYFYPDSIKDNTYIPDVQITAIKIFDYEVSGEPEELVLSYNDNFFSIEFTSLDYANPIENKYSYMLEGLESNWRFTDARNRLVFYTNLQPGDYVFKVRGTNSDGIWNNEGDSIKITILPPFWMRWWFIDSIIVLSAIMLYYIFTLRYRHLLTIEKLKTKLAADLHDNVGAGLTEIAILTELTTNELNLRNENNFERLNKISDTARLLVDNMSDIVWVVNPKRDSLYDLIVRLKESYRDFLSSLGISLKTNNLDKLTDIKLPMDYKQNLFLIFKEAIHNAIKHSRCKNIFLEVYVRGDVLEMTVKDDGIGMEQIGSTTGEGIRNIKNRAALIGGKLKWSSALNEGTTLEFVGKISRTNKIRSIFNL